MGQFRTAPSGIQYWFTDQGYIDLNRIDGPTILLLNGLPVWWVNRKKINTNEVLRWYIEQQLDWHIPLTLDEQILFKLKFG